MARQTTQKLTRAQIREGFDTIPVDILLGAGQGKTPALTTKQRNFAHAIALGQTKADAYRGSYKATATKRTLASKPYELARDERVKREAEAYRVALETEKHRTPAQLKALLVQQLVQHSLDDDFPPASRVQCLKLLGSLFEVGAFVERKEITTVNRSEDIRTRLLSRLQTITVDADVKADDALDLLAEIRTAKESARESPVPVDDGATSTPTAGAPPLSGLPGPAAPIHTIPLKRSQEELKRSKVERSPPTTLTEPEIVDDFDE
jgi:hypothetical protein